MGSDQYLGAFCRIEKYGRNDLGGSGMNRRFRLFNRQQGRVFGLVNSKQETEHP